MTTLLVPFSLFLLYCSLKKLFPQKTSLIAVIILGLHPLLLLHARRAMAESALLFGVVFFLWATSQENRKPALIGVALAVAINAKQTAIALLPVGIIAVCWLPIYNRNLRKMLTRIAKLLSVFLIATFLLNPFIGNTQSRQLKSATSRGKHSLKGKFKIIIQNQARTISLSLPGFLLS